MKKQEITLEQFSTQVSQQIFDRIPSTIARTIGLTREAVEDDLQAEISPQGDLKPKFKELHQTIDGCWEDEMSIDRAVNTLLQPYHRLVLGQMDIV